MCSGLIWPPARTNGVELQCVMVDEGPLVILLHGGFSVSIAGGVKRFLEIVDDAASNSCGSNEGSYTVMLMVAQKQIVRPS